jgi:hypothetical protein
MPARPTLACCRRGGAASALKQFVRAVDAYSDILPEMLHWCSRGERLWDISRYLMYLGHSTRTGACLTEVQVHRAIERHFELVELIREWRARGRTYRRISDRLNQLVGPGRIGPAWTPLEVRRTLRPIGRPRRRRNIWDDR